MIRSITDLCYLSDLAEFWSVDVMPSIDQLTMKPKRSHDVDVINYSGAAESRTRTVGYTGSVGLPGVPSLHHEDPSGSVSVSGESVFVFGNESTTSPTDYYLSQPTNGLRIEGAVSRAETEEKLRRYSRVLNRAELELMLVRLPIALGLIPQAKHGDRFCAGLLGFPNGLWLLAYFCFIS